MANIQNVPKHAGKYRHMVADGTLVELCEMTDKWLASTIKHKEAKAAEGVDVWAGNTDGTLSEALEMHVVYGKKALKLLNHHEYVAERDRREKIRDAKKAAN